MRSGTGFWTSWPAAGSHRKRRCACFKAHSGIAIGPGGGVGGALRLTAREGPPREAQAPPRGDLEVRTAGDHIEVSSRAACLIFLPEGAEVSGEAGGGGARIPGVRGELRLGGGGGGLRWGGGGRW